jgi:hypothetical protein
VNHHGSDGEIEDVVSGRRSARHERGKNDDLERIRDDGQHHGGSKARTGRNCDCASVMSASCLYIFTMFGMPRAAWAIVT